MLASILGESPHKGLQRVVMTCASLHLKHLHQGLLWVVKTYGSLPLSGESPPGFAAGHHDLRFPSQTGFAVGRHDLRFPSQEPPPGFAVGRQDLRFPPSQWRVPARVCCGSS